VVVLRDGVIVGDLRRSDNNHSDADWADQLAGWLTSHGT
jgi:hypothetical protein